MNIVSNAILEKSREMDTKIQEKLEESSVIIEICSLKVYRHGAYILHNLIGDKTI